MNVTELNRAIDTANRIAFARLAAEAWDDSRTVRQSLTWWR